MQNDSASKNKPKILILVRYYIPGYKSGGQLRSVANIVNQFSNEYDFRIICLDRDLGDTSPYKNIIINGWNHIGNADVIYIKKEIFSCWSIIKIIRKTPHDIIYLNSFFDGLFTVCPLIAHLLFMISRTPIIMAVRGELAPEALHFKFWKKHAYIAIFKKLRIINDILWQASSHHEAEDIWKNFGRSIRVRIAQDIPSSMNIKFIKSAVKNNVLGVIKIIYLSRINRIKNLKYALNILSKLEVPAIFNLYGEVDDKKYWNECLICIKRLPKNIQVNYHGHIPHDLVGEEMAKHDLFFLPTLGENYGHVIYEALASGVPVLISDKTPWRNLARIGVGYDIPLTDSSRFIEIIKLHAFMSETDRTKMRSRIHKYAKAVFNSENIISANRNLFEEAIRDGA